MGILCVPCILVLFVQVGLMSNRAKADRTTAGRAVHALLSHGSILIKLMVELDLIPQCNTVSSILDFPHYCNRVLFWIKKMQAVGYI